MGLAHEAAERLEAFFRGFAGSTAPLLLLDYDGTLAPFRVDRFKAKPWAGVSELLNRIQGQTKTQMVFITGRPAAEILPLLGLDAPVEVWGLHGTERLYPRRSTPSPSEPLQMERRRWAMCCHAKTAPWNRSPAVDSPDSQANRRQLPAARRSQSVLLSLLLPPRLSRCDQGTRAAPPLLPSLRKSVCSRHCRRAFSSLRKVHPLLAPRTQLDACVPAGCR